MKPRLLDLFCCAGGAAMGYYRAGFEVVGVDIEPQPHYPFEFHQADALEYLAEHGQEFDAIHASPPCQGYSVTQAIHGYSYPKLVNETRDLLEITGKPYVIENVPGAPLKNPAILNGLMFGLKLVRNRAFETNWILLAPPKPRNMKVFTNSGRGYSSFENGATHITVAGHNFVREDGIKAFGDTCEWMTREELAEAIPPAYTELIGRQLMQVLEVMR